MTNEARIIHQKQIIYERKEKAVKHQGGCRVLRFQALLLPQALRRLFWNRHFVHGQVHTTLNENLFPSKRIRFGFSDIH